MSGKIIEADGRFCHRVQTLHLLRLEIDMRSVDDSVNASVSHIGHGRPRMHAWFESVSQGDLLGTEVGAGVECVCTGGMHSLVIDELGRVRVVFYVISF